MKFAAAQTNPVRGDIQANIQNHKTLIELAISHSADIIIFPELSLTGYEPALARQLATSPFDPRLDDFQTVSDGNHLTIGVGLPLKNEPRPTISMVIFQPHQPRRTYSKRYIHADEEPYFIGGPPSSRVLTSYPNIALAICYEISVPDHAKAAHQNGSEMYLASVVKNVTGTAKAHDRLAEIARAYSMTVMMANCVGVCDGEICGGRSAGWNNKGEMLGQLNDTDEGIFIVDTERAGSEAMKASSSL